MDAMTLLDDFFSKKPIEIENMSIDETRRQPQPITNIEELDASLEPLEPSEPSSQTSDAESGRSSVDTSAR